MTNINYTPIYKSLVNHNKNSLSSFHTPGHKGNLNIPPDFYKFDLTELPDTDSLYDAKGPILNSEINASKIFNTNRTIFSAMGCTLCIQTMLKLTCHPGDKIIADRNSHRSLINTLALIDVNPIWIYPELDNSISCSGKINPLDIQKSLENNPDAKAVYITSPNYFGIISDIQSISNICKIFNVPLLIDNAHGSHLYFLGGKFKSDLMSSDLIACSLHKTLPVFTGGAILNINNKKYSKDSKTAMSLFGSTSPSYPIMASIDLCLDWLKNHAEDEFLKLKNIVSKINCIAQKHGFLIPESFHDPVRITLDSTNIGLTGNDTAELMRSKGIEVEYCNENCIILIPTPFNSHKDFEKLLSAIKNTPKSKPIKIKPFNIPRAVSKLSIRESIFSNFEITEVDKADGKISAFPVSTCPPGIPLLMPGEIISKEIIEFLKEQNILTIKTIK